ncbi:gliding motility-associated C-terminal domain-containing protein, partial [Labilibaculum sp.]|uniref:T9SS type B sorting domain-containing protein n=1 Tax=Labilibaculum sp. TaxID=2060723 RepID=UPI0035659D7D
DTVLLEPEKLTTSELTVDDVDCNGESSGEIYVVGTQGTPDYTYSVDGLESDSGIFTDLDPGDYTVQIVDANACVYDTLVTVGEPSVIGFLIEDVVLPTCENTNDGIIQITPYGGNSGYTFSWSGPDDYRSYSQNLENLAAGDYTLLINDIENCSGEGEVDLSLGYTIQLGLIVEQDVTTSGGSDGILTVETSEGTTPYSFTISGPDGYSYSSPSGYDNSSSTIENLAAGVYTVVATDVSGCSTVEKSTIIDEPGAIFAYIEEIQSVGCSTNNVGELKAHASGSTGSYTYSWSSTSGYTGSGQIITGLSEGTYILTVTSGSETATDTYELVAPDALTVSVASVVNVTCNNEANGEIELDVDAGSADYSIEWTSDNGFYSTAEHILDLEPGTYDYTVTTEYGCSVSGSETISEPTLLELSVTTDNYSGAGTGDGKLSASVTGGTPPYTFLVYGPSDFSKSDTNTSGTYSLSGLLKGYYEVFVLDANECRVESSDKVYETDILVLFTSSITSVTCPGGSDGAISVDVLGESDSTNISYSWTGDNYFTSTEKDISGLKAGDYTVTVYDSEGDAGYESQSLEITVSEPDELVPEYWKKDITCYGLDDGYINLHPQGGTPSYTYSWTGTGVVATNEDQQGLSEGTYTIQITDSNGCVSETESITIEEPSQVTVSISDYSEPTCYGLEDGWITVDISDGSGPYLINWDDYGSISEDIYDLEAGDYSIVVTDKNGCETVDTLVLNQPDSLIAEINDYDDVSCYNLKTGRAIVDISGGTPSYTISWSDGQNTDEAYNLGTGRYEVTVVDEHACSDTSSVEITQPEAIVLKVNATRPTTIDAYDGSIRIDVSGGVEDYNINWLDVDGIYYGSGLSIEDLDADTYKVHVLDANSCRRDSTIVLDYLYETQIKIPKAFTPNGDGYNDYWDLERIEYVQDLKIIIYDRWGKEVYNFSGTGNEYRGNPWTGEDGNSDAAIGSYYYAVILNDEKPLMGTVTILR